MSNTKSLGDASRRLAKERFKTWLEGQTDDSAVIVFMLEQFELAYDLIVASIESGGVPTKGDIIRYFGAKGVSMAGLADNSRVACVSSIVSFGLTASAAPAAGVGGPAAWAWYIGALMLDGLDIGGNCYLAWQDHQIDGQLAAFQKQIDARRMQGHGGTRLAIDGRQSVVTALDAMLDWQRRQPPQCTLPARDALPGLAQP